jgi:ATP-binding cassette, subfamily B (MDR/TAP), member 1
LSCRIEFISGFALLQKMWLSGFSSGIQEMHRKASLVLEDAVRNIYTVVAFCAGNKIMELYRLQLGNILMKSFVHGMGIGFAFGLSQFLLFACNALLLWYTAVAVRDGHLSLVTALKEYSLLLCDFCAGGTIWPCPIYFEAPEILDLGI